MTLNVTVDKILFENTQDGFTILLVSDNDSKNYQQYKVKANTVGINESMTLILEGDWESNTKYGKTFNAVKWKEVLPTNAYGIKLYLESGIIKGVGSALAEAIVSKFKEKTLEIIDTHSKDLLTVPKIGAKKAQQIWESWDEHKYMRESISYLLDLGISVAFAIKIFKVYGNETINQIKKNPYQLIYDVDGIGFQRADEIALNLGFDKKHPERIKAGIVYVLKMDAEDGNTYMEIKPFLSKTSELLAIDWQLIMDVINSLVSYDNDIIIVENERIYLPQYYNAEKNIANKMRIMTRRLSAFNDGKDIDISKIEEELDIKYEPEQINAIQTALHSNVMVLTGGPGTGKTTVARLISKIYKQLGALEKGQLVEVDKS